MCRTYLILHVKLVDYDFIDTIKLLDLLLTVPFKFLACMKTFGSYLLFNSCLVGLRIVTAVGSSMRLDKFEILEVLVPGGYRGRATSMPNHPSCKSKGYTYMFSGQLVMSFYRYSDATGYGQTDLP